MAVWTIAAEARYRWRSVAAQLAASSDAALLDRSTLALFARELNPDFGDGSGIEERVGGRLNLSALSIAMSTGSEEAFRELRMMPALPELGRTILRRAAQTRCVILAAAGFAALGRAPVGDPRAPAGAAAVAHRRVSTENLVDRRCAEKAVRHDDHVKRAWVRTLYGLDIDDARRFALTIDASRIPADRIVGLLLAASGVSAESSPPARSLVQAARPACDGPRHNPRISSDISRRNRAASACSSSESCSNASRHAASICSCLAASVAAPCSVSEMCTWRPSSQRGRALDEALTREAVEHAARRGAADLGRVGELADAQRLRRAQRQQQAVLRQREAVVARAWHGARRASRRGNAATRR